MTLEEFAKKWEHKTLPDAAGQLLGSAIGILCSVGFSRDEIMELTSDVYDLSIYMESEEGQEEAVGLIADLSLAKKEDLH